MTVFRTVLMQILILAITLIALVIADRVTGRLVPALKLARQLYPPHSEITMKTPEFTYTAHVNGQGFRDREFGSPRAGRIRAVAIGDSFTFGWGVPVESSWVKRLELGLGKRGEAIEIANLGKPGSGPVEYAAVAQVAAAVLRPGLVMVALQQTDDLQQAVMDPVFLGLLKQLGRATLATRIDGLLRRAFPNFLLLLSSNTVETVRWRSTVERILALVSDIERRRFERLDPEVRRLFQDGALNPGLLVLAVKAPTYYAEMTDPAAPRMRERLDAIVTQLESIKHAASRIGAQAIVISVPNRAYVSDADLANVRRLGFETRPGMADWTGPDDAIREVATRAGLRSIIVTDGFREACRAKPCYFAFDDHFNENGHQVYAELVASALDDMMHSKEGPR
jgi:lysophospholipase L1-like esterase